MAIIKKERYVVYTMTAGKYFNRGVMALDSPYIGHVVRETDDKLLCLVREMIDTTFQNQKFR
jgi:hypothetical protein